LLVSPPGYSFVLAMASPKEATTEKNPGGALIHPPVVVDLGRRTKKKINKLKKAEGSLYKDVCETVEVMQSDDVVGKDVQVVVVVVEKLPDGMVFPKMPWN
jgi:hypothetical protein